MKTLYDLFNQIIGGKNASDLIQDKDERTTGTIGEAILRMAVALHINPNGSNTQVTGIIYNVKTTRFDSINNIETYLATSNIANSNETGKIDAAWMTDVYCVCSSKIGKNEIPSLDCLEMTQIHSEIAIGKITHNDTIVDPNKTMYYALVRNKTDVHEMLKRKRFNAVRRLLSPENVLDIDDLDRICFKIRDIAKTHANPIHGFMNKKSTIALRFHQELICRNVISKNSSKILIGAIPRSGKTYIGAKLCVGYSKILILTTRPTETRDSWGNIFKNAAEFDGYTIQNMSSDIENETVNENTIIIASTQFFKHGDRRNKRGIEWDVVLIDEIHEGGCTDKSKQIMENNSGVKTKFILMTATYEKPIAEFGLAKEDCFFWDLEDVRLVKNWNVDNIARLHEKHGNMVLTLADEFRERKHDIAKDYAQFPEPHLLTTVMQQKYYAKLVKLMDTPKNTCGFSMRSLFMTTKDNTAFQNPTYVDRFLELISGSNFEEDFDGFDNSMIERIRRIQRMNGHNRVKSFLTMQWFLPYGIGQTLEGVKNALIERIKMNDVFRKYAIMTLDSGDVNIPARVSAEITKAKSMNKIGLIILTGDVGSLGVSVPEIDATFLMHDFESSDKTFQQLTRCLTEDYENGKRVGVIVDFNVWRVLNTLSTYAIGRCGKTFKDSTEKITWCLSNLIRIDSDLWECSEVQNSITKQSLIEELTTQWTKMMESAGYNLVTLERQVVDIGDDQSILNSIIKYSASSKSSKTEKEKMPDGVSVKTDSDDESVVSEKTEKTEKLKNINLNEILARLIPEMAILTGGKMNLHDAFEYIGNTPSLRLAMNGFLNEFAV